MDGLNQSKQHLHHGVGEVLRELKLKGAHPKQVVPIRKQEDATQSYQGQVCRSCIVLTEVPNLCEEVDNIQQEAETCQAAVRD
jgi:hypothetical protein